VTSDHDKAAANAAFNSAQLHIGSAMLSADYDRESVQETESLREITFVLCIAALTTSERDYIL